MSVSRSFRRLSAAAALSAALAATPSQAGVRLELGGDWAYYYYGGTVELMIGVSGPLAKHSQVGSRQVAHGVRLPEQIERVLPVTAGSRGTAASDEARSSVVAHRTPPVLGRSQPGRRRP